jgi:hypothetical protein
VDIVSAFRKMSSKRCWIASLQAGIFSIRYTSGCSLRSASVRTPWLHTHTHPGTRFTQGQPGANVPDFVCSDLSRHGSTRHRTCCRADHQRGELQQSGSAIRRVCCRPATTSRPEYQPNMRMLAGSFLEEQMMQAIEAEKATRKAAHSACAPRHSGCAKSIGARRAPSPAPTMMTSNGRTSSRIHRWPISRPAPPTSSTRRTTVTCRRPGRRVPALRALAGRTPDGYKPGT